MAGKARAALVLTSRQKDLLLVFSKRGDTGQRIAKRICIILRSSEGESSYSISKGMGIKYDSVQRWRNRWELGYESLLIYEQGDSGEGVKDISLLKKMLELLEDKERSGTPSRISLSAKQQIAAIACGQPSDYGIPQTKWTHELLAEVAQSEKVVSKISARYIGVLLKKSGHTSA